MWFEKQSWINQDILEKKVKNLMKDGGITAGVLG